MLVAALLVIPVIAIGNPTAASRSREAVMGT